MAINLDYLPCFKQAPSKFNCILLPLEINPAARLLSDLIGLVSFFFSNSLAFHFKTV